MTPRYRSTLEITHLTVDGKPRVQLCDPDTENEVRLGPIEYRVATLFDGTRTLEDISRVLAEMDGINCPPPKVAGLADRLVKFGVLEVPGAAREEHHRNPFTGLESGGKFHQVLVIRLLEVRGDAWLVRLLARAPFLGSRAFLALCVAAVAAAASLLVAHRAELARDLGALDTSTGRFWLLLVALGNAANAVHELAHAIACRAQGVRVLSMGWVLHYFLLGAWVRPGKAWRELRRPGRLLCVLAGPLASALVSGGGLLLWYLGDGLAAEVGLILAISSIVGAVITMVPVHTGDGYVILTDLLSVPDLRQQAMTYLRSRIERREVPLPRTRRALLGGFAASVVAWRIVLVSLLLYALWHVPVTFGGVPVVGILVATLLFVLFRRLSVAQRASR